MTNDFEAWWANKGQDLIFPIYNLLDDNAISTVKKIAWEAWKQGREKLHNEFVIPQVQTKR
jgi:hypothetical protein